MAESKLVSWSKNGFIAYPCNVNNFNVAVTHMECINGAIWRLAAPYMFRTAGGILNITTGKANSESSKSSQQNAPQIVYLQWSNIGDYLACFDERGNFSIIGYGLIKENNSMNYSLSPFNHSAMLHLDSISSNTNDKDLNTDILIFEWLPVHKSNPRVIPATRNPGETQFNYGISSLHNLGFSHPVSGKQACLGLRKNGELCLWYQTGQSFKFLKIDYVLEPNGLRYMTHASIAFLRDGSAMLVTYNSALKCLKTYVLTISWGLLPEKKEAELQSVPPKVNPKLTVKRKFSHYLKNLNEKGASQEVKYIKVVSSSHVSDADLNLIIIYEEKSLGSKHVTSNICRYQMDNSNIFKSHIFANRSNDDKQVQPNSSENDYKDGFFKSLILKESFSVNAKIIQFDTACKNLYLFLITENNETLLLYANDMNKKITEEEYEKKLQVRSLYDADFKVQLPKIPIKYCSLSPSMSACVCLSDNSQFSDKLSLFLAQRHGIHYEKELNNIEKQIIATAFAISHSETSFYNMCCDDLIAALQKEIMKYKVAGNNMSAEVLNNSVIKESHLALRFSLIYSNNQLDKLVGNFPLQKLVSLQMSLGTFNDFKRNKTGKMAWVILNLRLCTFGTMITIKTWYRDAQKMMAKRKDVKMKNVPLYNFINGDCKAYYIAQSLGSTKWLLDLSAYICQDFSNIITMSSKIYNPNKEYVYSLFKQSTALPIVMGKISRVLLIGSLKGLKLFILMINRFCNEYDITRENPVYSAIERLREIIEDSIVPIELFETFLTSIEGIIDSSFKDFCKDKNYTQEQSTKVLAEIEHKIICKGEIPEEIFESGRTILKNFNESIKEKIDMTLLFSTDLKWLALYDSQSVHFDKQENNLKKESTKKRKHSNCKVIDTNPLYVSPSYCFDRSDKIDYLRKVIIPKSTFINVVTITENIPPTPTTAKAKGRGRPKKQQQQQQQTTQVKVEEKVVTKEKCEAKLRRCVRCGSMSSSLGIYGLVQLNQDERGRQFIEQMKTAGWDMAFQRNCFCGACWVSIN